MVPFDDQPKVEITDEDWDMAALYASSRQKYAVKSGRVAGRDHGGHSNRRIGERFGNTFIGKIGEILVARYLQLPMTATYGKMQGSDLPGLEVKATEWPKGYLAMSVDAKDEPHILVIPRFYSGNGPIIGEGRIVGWCSRAEGQATELKPGDPPKYEVPQSILHPIATLPTLVKDVF